MYILNWSCCVDTKSCVYSEVQVRCINSMTFSLKIVSSPVALPWRDFFLTAEFSVFYYQACSVATWDESSNCNTEVLAWLPDAEGLSHCTEICHQNTGQYIIVHLQNTIKQKGASAWPSHYRSLLRITGTRLRIPLEARFFPNLNNTSSSPFHHPDMTEILLQRT